MTLRRPKNPGTRRDVKRSPAQEVAWTAFRLRALWHQASLLTGERRAAAQAAVDAELERIGYPTESERQAVRRARWDAELQSQPEEFEEVA